MGHVGKQLFLVTAGWRRSRAECPHTPVVFVVVCSPIAAAVRTLLLFSRARVFLPRAYFAAAAAAQVTGTNR